MAKLEDLKIGDHVSFRLMSNKDVSMTGTIAKFHEEDPSLVDIFIDEHPLNSIDTAYVDDVTVIETPAGTAADLRSMGIAATAEPEGIEVDISKAPPDAPSGDSA